MHSQTSTRVEIEVVASGLLNYAMAHNRMPLLKRIGLGFPHSREPIEQVSVAAHVQAPDGGVLTRSWQTTLTEVDPNRPVAIDNPPLRLDPGQISTLEEEVTAEIVVSVTLPGQEPVISYTPVRVLAARQWLIEPPAPLVSLELLAAFVQPNHPEVEELVSGLGDRLMARTRDSSLAVQHVTPKRIDAIVEAICAAIQEHDISYAEPPASWGYGQKVRDPGQVLSQGVGTCLDTTILLASVLEHVGIAPVIWVAQGHAFVGWWRQAALSMPEAASLQLTSAINAVDLELVGVLETTALTRQRRPPRDLFRRVRQMPMDTYFRGHTDQLVGVVDVSMSRTMGVLPLPARRVRADGVVEVIEYHAAAPAEPIATNGAPAEAVPRPVREERPPPPRIQSWKQSLLDLTLRNPLLNLGRGITQLPLQVPHGGLVPLARLVQDGQPVTLRAGDDLAWFLTETIAEASASRSVSGLPADLQRSLLTRFRVVFGADTGDFHSRLIARLRYRARTARQETGANLLTLTLGRLDWTLGERELSAPLLLAPVELKGVTQPYKIALDPAGEITLNLSLLEKLRVEFGLTFPELAELPRLDDGNVDVEQVLRTVRAAIAAAELPFRVDEDARLAIIAFTGYLLWRDLDTHWETFLQRPLVRHLALNPTEDFVDPTGRIDEHSGLNSDPGRADLDELTAAAPIPVDGSQAEAVDAARAGHSFVLEGPPGTGKSQTITNVIADQMAQGRTVLFVAEKGAALDVVRRRLEEVGLLPFTLDLHDDAARPATVRQQLKSALALRPQPDRDAYRLAASDVAAGSATLSAYARRVHEPNQAGLSMYAAHNLLLGRGEGPTLRVPPTATGLREVVQRAIPTLAVLGESTWQTWGFARRLPMDRAAVQAGAQRADAEVAQLVAAGGDPVGQLLVHAATPAELVGLLELLRDDAPAPDVLDEVGSPRWAAAHTELRQRTAAFRTTTAPLWSQLAPSALAVPIDPVRQSLREAASSFFIGRKGRMVRAAEPVLVHLRPGAQVAPAALPDLVERLAAAGQEHARLVASWHQLPGLTGLPPDLNLAAEDDPRLDETLDRLLRLAQLLRDLSPVRQAQVHQVRSARATIDHHRHATGHRAAQYLSEVFTAVDAQDSDIARWCGETGLLTRWEGTSDPSAGRDSDASWPALTRWCEAAELLEPMLATAPEARWSLLTGEVSPADAVAALERGLAEASVVERCQAGALDGFDPAAHERTLQRFIAAGQELRDTLRAVLPATVVERRPFTPGRLFGKVGALEREIGRTRGGLTVRQLMQRYGDVIAKVTPCVLVSPDSLARFIPPEAMPFDLVVFDEASQITVADAIGALGRAESAVIAGDSKQMPPTMFAALGADAEEDPDPTCEFTAIQDEESILSEAVLGGLPRLWLTWHYRSRDESLIAFSNEHYYDGRLLSFPTVPGRGHDTGVSFHRVQGTFIRKGGQEGTLRTNPAEAAAVVDEMLRRWRTGQRSIGVVTFNVQQRGLIEAMLAESGEPGMAESLADRHDGIFVKNLENVQGDERDVVIFSTGFSAAENGVLPLNFGPLNRQGGQRRLNVAVTRARRRVMVFSSFEPDDLRADQTSSIGIKHLREYLELAKHGARPANSTATVAAADRHRDEIAQALRERGFEVRTGLGLSEFQIDLAVGEPGASPVLAVLLDSPAWARRRTTADRDGLPVTVLGEVMGWPGLARVWLPAWLADRETVLAELAEQVRTATDRPQHRQEDVVTWVSAEADPEPVVLEKRAAPAADPVGLTSARQDHRSEFVAFEPSERGTTTQLDSQMSGWQNQALHDLMREIVAVEGPICVPRLARLVVRCYRLTRVSDTRLAGLRSLVPADLRRDEIDGFVWPPERDPLRWSGYRSSTSLKERPLEEVATLEIANAAVDIARNAMGISVEDLLRESIRTFGGTRVTATNRGRLLAAVQHAADAGRLNLAGGIVTPAHP